MTAYAIVAFIGVRNSIVDIVVGTAHQIYRPVDEPAPAPQSRTPVDETPAFDWQTALYYGSDPHAVGGLGVQPAEATPLKEIA